MNHSKAPGRVVGLILLFWSLVSLGLVTDSEQTIEFESDSAEFHDVEGLTVYQGNVRLTQGSIVLQAERITLRSSGGQITSLVAEGSPANYVQTIDAGGETVNATSNHMEYQISAGVLTLTEEARLTLQGTTLSGNQIIYDVQRHILKAASQGDSVRGVRVTIPAAVLRETEGEAQ